MTCSPVTFAAYLSTLSADDTVTESASPSLFMSVQPREVFTIYTCVIRFYVGFFDLAILDFQSIPLAPIVAEDGGALEREV